MSPLSEIRDPRPGQFFMVGASCKPGEKGFSHPEGLRKYDPLLKRPFSVFDTSGGDYRILYRIVGKGTALLGQMKPGETIEVLGPLGNSWPAPGGEKSLPVLVAGGVGMASLFLLMKELKRKPVLIYGARCAEDLLMLDELKAMALEVITGTDDGSCGNQANAGQLLERFSPPEGKVPVIYACGPKPMLRAVSEVAASRGYDGYMSMEESMACGLGACLGCPVNTRAGYKRACKEGPVFKISDLVFEEAAKEQGAACCAKGEGG